MSRRARWIGAVLTLAMAALAMQPMLLGHMPWSHDHPVHLFKAWSEWSALQEGRGLTGWSSAWFFGFPRGELYPVGPVLWVLLFRWCSPDWLGWDQVYAVSFAAAYLMIALSVYALAQRLAGAFAGVIAAVLWILDPGSAREGGWTYIVDYGVWAQPLSTAFLIFGLLRLLDGLAERRSGPLAEAALLGGLAVITHPFSLILGLLVAPVLMLRRRATDITLISCSAALAIGLSAFWLLPTLSRSGQSSNIGALGPEAGELLARLLEHGSPFLGGSFAITALALIGALGGLRRRDPGLSCTVLLLAFCVAASTCTFFDVLGLHRISSNFERVQFQRLLLPAKVLWFLLAGAGVSSVIAGARALLQRPDGPVLPSLVGLAALGLAVVDARLDLRRVEEEGWALLDLEDRVAWWPEFIELRHWISERKTEEPGFFRVATCLGGPDDHRLVALPVFTGVPVYKVGYTPANLFGGAWGGDSDALFARLSVRYLICDGIGATPDRPLVADFGFAQVFAVNSYQPQRYRLDGDGQVEQLRFDEEEIQLRLSNIGPDARLLLMVSAYPRWKATLNGADWPVDRARLFDDMPPLLMSVPAADGLLVLRYTALDPDWMGQGISVLALLVVGLMVLGDRASPMHQRFARILGPFGPLAARISRVITAIILLFALAALGLALLRSWTSDLGDSALRRGAPEVLPDTRLLP